MDLLADRVVLLAELDDLAELPFELLGPVAQREDLPLADRDRAAAVRVRDVDLGERFGVVLEKLGMLFQITCDLFGFHRSPFKPVSSFEVASLKLKTTERCNFET